MAIPLTYKNNTIIHHLYLAFLHTTPLSTNYTLLYYTQHHYPPPIPCFTTHNTIIQQLYLALLHTTPLSTNFTLLYYTDNTVIHHPYLAFLHTTPLSTNFTLLYYTDNTVIHQLATPCFITHTTTVSTNYTLLYCTQQQYPSTIHRLTIQENREFRVVFQWRFIIEDCSLSSEGKVQNILFDLRLFLHSIAPKNREGNLFDYELISIYKNIWEDWVWNIYFF